MFQKLIGKKKKEGDIFHIPQKKYTTDQKIISKMSQNALKDLYTDQQKYILLLVQKINEIKNEYQKLVDKIDELQQKNEVVNAQISRMTNQHQQLSIKFDNLQTSLQIVSSQNDQLFKKQIQFLIEQEINCDKLKNFNQIIQFYRERLSLCKKIQQQNKNLKNRYNQLEENLDQAHNTIKQLEKYKNNNDLLPNLMKQIQQLRQLSGKKQKEKQQLQIHFNKLGKNLIQKVGNQLQTVSTLKSAEDEELQQKYRSTCLDLQKKIQQNALNKDRITTLQQKNKQLTFSLGKNSQKVVALDTQISKLKDIINKKEEKLVQYRNRYQNLEQKLQNYQQNNESLQKQIKDLKIQNEKITLNISQSYKTIQSKKIQYNKLVIELQGMKQEAQNRRNQLRRQKQNRATIQQLLNNNNNTQMQSLMKIKSKNEGQIQQLRQINESLRKNLNENQLKQKQLIDEIQIYKQNIKHLSQQKKMIQQNVNLCIKISQQQSQKSKRNEKDYKKQIQQLKKDNQSNQNKIKILQNQNKNLTIQIQKLFKTLQSKQIQLKKNYIYIQQLQKQKYNINQLIGQKQQDNKIRIRKYQSQLNQQRIKSQNLNRKLSNQINKSQENKITMDNMYQQLLSKDKKIIHMETKLKQYKYIIQILKKQKLDLEQSYQQIINQNKSIEIPKIQNIQTNNINNPIIQKNIDNQKENLINQLLSQKQQNIVLLSENQSLRKKIQDLEDIITDKSKSIKILQEKRDQIMKQIDRVNKKSQQSGISNLISPPSVIRIQNRQQQNRQKKIAAKAHKGFDILYKLQHQLYKNFINVFAEQLYKQQVKSIESQINTIVKKSSDMRDIFEDYL